MTAVMTQPPVEPLSAADSANWAHEARLVEEARRGSRDAFGELVRRYERRVIHVLHEFVRDQDLAEDLAQETFVRVYQRLDQFDPARRFGPWLFRIGVNLALDVLRKRKRRGWWPLFSDSPSERPPDAVTADPRSQLDLSQEVRFVLDQLPEVYRTVLVLRDLENFSTSEIAATLGRKEATIRWRLAEARTRFQDIWSRRQADPARRAAAVDDPAQSVSPHDAGPVSGSGRESQR
jgi:RNA polymerase sigma-70 factor, ECF subfamily